uniref:Ribosomal protein S3 n=1 Tax=Saccharina japonica x Saccharina longissima TaxID=2511829 RepID=A0A411DG88_9PHAE|nr:ribosomal protein S3 [Saccharina japonica x Saccharina longissima]QBA19374.1 ribosomal protein S3 [Saccharina japonica x Saccharina longissima]
MAQKAHPTILKPKNNLYQGCTHWDKPQFFFILTMIQKLKKSCCLGTTHYLDKIQVNRHLGLILVEADLIHLHFRSKRRLKSRRYKENKIISKKQSWTVVACRLQSAVKLIQKFTGTKKVTLRINRVKTYMRSVPKPARRQMAYFTKSFNHIRYDYARYGMQLMYLLIKNKASATSLARFLKQNICSRQRRKRHYQFLAYIKQGFQALQEYKEIQGLKIQIKGRFTHKAKGRSRVWKYQMGQMPISQLSKNIQAEYAQTQTGYGSVGLKIWICNWNKNDNAT